MQAPGRGHRGRSSTHVSFGFSQVNGYHHEDSEGTRRAPRTTHSIIIMPQQSPKPNLSVRTHELVSLPRPGREDASLNSHPQGLLLGHQTLSHFEMARLEKDRRDWRELAAFLRTNDPPSTNFMSNTEHETCGKNGKKLAPSLKIFRRPAKKTASANCARPLQLPDSAVAARTTKGHWHIAISIPLSAISTFADDVQQAAPHPRVVEEEDGHPLTSPHPPAYRPSSAQNPRSGNISPTPSQNSIHPALRKEQSMPIVSTDRDRNDVLTGDAALTMKNYYRRERLLNDDDAPRPGPQSLDQVISLSRRDSATSPTSPASPNNTSALMKRGTFGAVYAKSNEIERNNSQRTDPRHSGGTAYSERTLETMGHSRGPSAGSTSGGYMPTSIELPRRSSSRQVMAGPEPNPSGNATSPVSISRAVQRAGSGGKRREGHVANASGDSASSVAMMEATEGLQHQLASIRQGPRTPAPNRKLPDLPEGSDDGKGCACVNQHGRSRSDEGTGGAKKQLQDRQEKVKALRLRDIAKQKEKERTRRRSTHPPMSATMVCAPGCQHAKAQEETAPQQSRHTSTRSARHTPSLSKPKGTTNGGGITLSPIRTIASTSPSRTPPPLTPLYACATPTSTSQSLPDDFLDSLLPSYDYHRLSQRQSGLSNSSTQPLMQGRRGSGRSDGSRTGRTLTPPRSLSPSFASSDEDGVHLSRSPHSVSVSHSHSHSSTSHRNSQGQGPRTPRHKITHARQQSSESLEGVREIKERMRRLERENERILKTLRALMGMQRGVRELCELLSPAARPEMVRERPLTLGDAAAGRVIRPLGGDMGEEDGEMEVKPLSLRGSPGTERGEQMMRRMKEMESDIERVGRSARLESERGREGESGWELSAVEPLMREVRRGARVSEESRREVVDGEGDGEEEGLGYELMVQGC